MKPWRRHDGYVLASFLSALGSALLFLTALVVVYDLAERLDRLPDALRSLKERGRSPVGVMVEYYATLIPFLWMRILPVAVLLALVRSELSWKERLTAAWFGPKGFASVLFGLLMLGAPLVDREMLFHAIALVTLSSIVVHSTTDFFVSAWFCPGPKETRGDRAVESVVRAGT